MKVLYEISNLGFTFEDERWRTGIFRVSAELLAHLTAAPALDCALASLYSFVGELKAAAYLEREMPHLLPRLRNVWKNPLRFLGEADDLTALSPPGEDTEALRQRNELRQRLNRRLALPLRESFDIVHSFRHPLPERERVDARARVLQVYDPIPLLWPECLTEQTRFEFAQSFASVDTERDWVITASESSKRDFCRHTGMSTARVFVVPNAAATEVFHPQTDEARLRARLGRYGLDGPPYILAVSTLEPRKNLLHLLECFLALCRDGAAGESRLVLVGPDGWMFEPTLERWRREPVLRQRVLFTGRVPDADLRDLYTGARLFVCVSQYEGFGLPPLEAMSCGVPCVVSDNSSLPEVVGEAGLLVPPDDDDALREALRRLLSDDVLRAELAAKALARAASFGWERSAAQVIEVYRNVCAETRCGRQPASE